MRGASVLVFALSLALGALGMPAGAEGTVLPEGEGASSEASVEAMETAIVEEAASLLPSAWAGSWRGDDGALVLGFTSSPEAALSELRGRVGPATTPAVRAERVRFSMNELRAVDDQLWELATQQPGVPGLFAWSLKPERNRLVAYVQSIETVRTAFVRAGVDMETVEFEQRDQDWVFRPFACIRTDCFTEPVRGGLTWVSAVGSQVLSACTTGFGARQNGMDGFISAGHCAPEGAFAILGDLEPPFNPVLYGTVTASVSLPGISPPESDSRTTDGLFARKSPQYPQESRGWVYVSPSDPKHEIKSRESRDGYRAGDRTCFSGMTSGFACGRIIEGSFSHPQIGVRDFVLTDDQVCGDAGDSGAPVFSGDKAQGVLVGGLARGPEDPCEFALYTKLFHVERDTDARIILEDGN